jgi:ABC-type Mn2+/Zn2+ transport system permease subunit
MSTRTLEWMLDRTFPVRVAMGAVGLMLILAMAIAPAMILTTWTDPGIALAVVGSFYAATAWVYGKLRRFA